jgi:predicted nucleic acid-binding protein
MLLGKDIVIAAQTEGELRFGALAGGWGARRFAALEMHLVKSPTVPVTADVVRSFASVRADCKQAGHHLADKKHMGDAWIAATAHAYRLPLLSGDEIYRHAPVPGLRLLEENNG